MTFGINVNRANGTLLISSEVFGLVFVDMVTVQPGVDAAKSYPAFYGKTIKTLSGSLAVISYPGGVPTITVDASKMNRIEKIYIFAQ